MQKEKRTRQFNEDLNEDQLVLIDELSRLIPIMDFQDWAKRLHEHLLKTFQNDFQSEFTRSIATNFITYVKHVVQNERESGPGNQDFIVDLIEMQIRIGKSFPHAVASTESGDDELREAYVLYGN